MTASSPVPMPTVSELVTQIRHAAKQGGKFMHVACGTSWLINIADALDAEMKRGDRLWQENENLKLRLEQAAKPTKCDGNHGGPRCADPECWQEERPYCSPGCKL